MKQKMTQQPAVSKPIEFTRADPAQLAKFDARTKVCTMNCGPHRDDPRETKERKFLCGECETNEAACGSSERRKIKIYDLEIIDSLELFSASELEVMICKLPSGEEVIVFEDCTGEPPIIYKWCMDMANEWLRNRPPNA